MMAEAYLRSLALDNTQVISSGTVADEYRQFNAECLPHILAHIEKYGVTKYAKLHPDQLTQARIDSANITICMNQIVADECFQLFSMPTDTIIWDVTDVDEGNRVIKQGDDRYQFVEETYEEIAHNIDELLGEKGVA